MRQPGRRTALRCGLAALCAPLAAGCVSVGVGEPAPARTHLRLTDPGAGAVRRDHPLVAALLVQPQPGDAIADTTSIAYARAPERYAFYQFAVWTERPLRQLPLLLQRRLEARGVAGAVGLAGDPLRADWLLALRVDTLHHDVEVAPGRARLALTAELFDRRRRVRVARQSFAAEAPVARAEAGAAVEAMSQAVGQAFDALVPWLEGAVTRALAAPPAPPGGAAG